MRPPIPTPTPPMAGHHIQCKGSRSNMSSKPYIMRLMPAANRPMTAPVLSKPAAIGIRSTPPMVGIGKRGPGPRRYPRRIAAVALAIATGTRLRGLSSKSRSSTARRMAATGVANVADIPAAAPATRRVVRSASVSLIHCAMSEPKAPPVMMMGPSAPNGPPEPIAIAAEIGFRMAILGSTRARFNKIASIASGIPWPLILSEPKRAIHSNQEPSNHRNDHHPVAQRAARRGDGERTEAVIVEKIGSNGDQS